MVLLVSFILLAALVGLTLNERENPTWPEAMLIDTFGWVQGVIYSPVHHVAGFFEDIRDIKKLYDENAKLKASLNEYSSMRVRIEGLERENKKLKEDLGLRDTSGFKNMISANVVGRSPSKWNSEITIDVGSKDGVEKDTAVITAGKGLVGRVYEVSPYHSKVLLITDREKINVSAKVLNQDDKNVPHGIVRGATGDASQTNDVGVEREGGGRHVGRHVRPVDDLPARPDHREDHFGRRRQARSDQDGAHRAGGQPEQLGNPLRREEDFAGSAIGGGPCIRS